MPIYTFENTKTGKVYDEMMTISEMERYLKKNKHIKQQIGSINIVGGISGMTYKTDAGWKENLSRIAEKHPESNLGKRYGRQGVKESRTRAVLDKHRKRAKNK